MKRNDLDFYIKHITDKGGSCLDCVYVNSKTKIAIKCKNDHIFLMKPCHLRLGHWCPHCAGLFPKTLDYLKKLALNKNGECLSCVYDGMGSVYTWKCSQNHIWSARGADISLGHWCSKCSRDVIAVKLRTPDSKLCMLAGSRCGKFCGRIENSKMCLWECKDGHSWIASFGNVSNRNSWCPTCFGRRSRKELELFVLIKESYPDAISGVKGLLKNKRFELDIYIPSIKTAVEFDGTYWHTSQWAINHGIPDREIRKNSGCIDVGIKLIRISEAEFDQDKYCVFMKI